MLYYILQIIAFQVVFLMVYDLFLKRETFFNHNRFYLLGTAILSFVLPFIKLDIIKAIAPSNFVVTLPEVIIGDLNAPTTLDKEVALQAGIVLETSSTPILQIILLTGMVLATLFLIFKISKLFLLKSKSPKRWKGNILLVKLLKSSSAFSFFNTVFLGEKISKKQQVTIYEHELVHVKQLHSLDLMLFEFMRIFMWFNPLVYMYQNRIKTLHEYIADKKAIKQNGKKTYYNQLLNQVFETNDLSFTNSFFKKSLIKKRITMLQKSKSKKVNVFKYALLIPVVFGMLFYVSCDKEIGSQEIAENINLEEYVFKIYSDENLKSKENIAKRDKFQGFLKTHPNYVSWSKQDTKSDAIIFSVHHKDEVIPEGYMEFTTVNEDGKLIKSYHKLSPSKKVTEIEKLNPRDYVGKSEVPFRAIDNVPTFPECQSRPTMELQKQCVNQKVAMYVNKNFDTNLATSFGLEGKQKIYTKFKINKNGDVVDIKARAPHPGLEDEAKRVIGGLPKFIPGEHNGNVVKVEYYLPIVFQIN